MPPSIVPLPQWQMTAAHDGRICACPTNRCTWMLGGCGPSAAGSPLAPTVSTRFTGESPTASMTVWNRSSRRFQTVPKLT